MTHKHVCVHITQTISLRTEAFFFLPTFSQLNLWIQGQYNLFHWYRIFVKGIRAMQWSSQKYSVHVADYNTNTHVTLRRPPLFSTQEDWCHPPVFPFALVIYTSLKIWEEECGGLKWNHPTRSKHALIATLISHLSAFLFTMKQNWRRCHSMYQEEVYLTVYLIWIFQNKKGHVADVILIYF